MLFTINRQQLEILHLLREKISPDAPTNTVEEKKLAQQVQQLEDQARDLEDELGAHRS